MNNQNNTNIEFLIEEQRTEIRIYRRFIHITTSPDQQFPSQEQEAKETDVNEVLHISELPEDIGNDKHSRNIDLDKDKKEHSD